jgi:hypothetical protein
MKIAVDLFKGIMPKVSNDKLSNEMAQVAGDVKTASGALMAFRRSTPDVELSSTEYKTFFEYLESGNTNWVYYNLIVHSVRSPTANDSFERMYMTGADSVNGKYKAFSNDIQGVGTFDFTTDFYYPGAPSGAAPTIIPDASAGDYVAYFYTYVSRYGEEGPPSAIGESLLATDDGRNDVDDIETPPTADEHLDTIIDGNIPKVYLYRTVDDGAGSAAFLFILEAEWFTTTETYDIGDYVVYVNDIWECTTQHTGAWNAGNFNKGENVLDADAGSVCTSIFYDRCPDDLTNLRGHPNGFFVASKNNVLYFSEPFAPWAWPEDYQIPIDQEIIGVGVYGSTIVVATDGNIYTFSGPHPNSLYKTKLAFQPCQSQRALVETDSGVLFPSLEGFQHVTAAGVDNMTRDVFKPEDWADYELDTMHGTWYNKAYYGFFKSPNHEGHIIIDTLNGAVTTGSKYHQAGRVGVTDGLFRTIVDSALVLPGVLFISRWDTDDSAYRNFSFKSKQYILEKPSNFKVAQVILDMDFYERVLGTISEGGTLIDLNQEAWDADDQLRATFDGFMFDEQDMGGDDLYSLSSLGVQDYVAFKIFVDGTLKFTKQVTTSTMFKLPRGFRSKVWEWSVDGMIPVKRVILATSTEEIV